MNKVLDIVTSKGLTYEQKVVALAHAAENSLEVLDIPVRTRHYMETGAICDLDEGHAPYRPRYIMPDYEKAVKNGCEFLQLDPPKDLDEVLQFLEIFYRHVPSITSYPVFLGNIDKLIEPFLEGVSDEEAEKKLKLFLIYLDRTITDGFCHANLGPDENRTDHLKAGKGTSECGAESDLKVRSGHHTGFLRRTGSLYFPLLCEPGDLQSPDA